MSFASYGNGHRVAAEAIVAAWRKAQPLDKISVIDALDVVYSPYAVLSRSLYRNAATYIPSVYDKYYRLGNVDRWVHLMRKVYSITSTRVHDLIELWKPTVVVCTHPLPLSIFAEFKNKYNKSFILSSVVTDYGINKSWAHSQVNYYFVPSLGVKKQLECMGISEHNIFISGIPSHSTMTPPINCNNRTDVDDNYVGFSAYGLNAKYAATILRNICNCESKFTIVICYGISQRIRDTFERIAQCSCRPYVIEPYGEDYRKWMKKMVLLLSKPGGLSITEALANNLPLILLRGYLGQERANAEYVVRNGAGLMPSNDDIGAVIDKLLGANDVILEMKNNSRFIGVPAASNNIVECINNALS